MECTLKCTGRVSPDIINDPERVRMREGVTIINNPERVRMNAALWAS
jgi:hypothetical protein